MLVHRNELVQQVKSDVEENDEMHSTTCSPTHDKRASCNMRSRCHHTRSRVRSTYTMKRNKLPRAERGAYVCNDSTRTRREIITVSRFPVIGGFLFLRALCRPHAVAWRFLFSFPRYGMTTACVSSLSSKIGPPLEDDQA